MRLHILLHKDKLVREEVDHLCFSHSLFYFIYFFFCQDYVFLLQFFLFQTITNFDSQCEMEIEFCQADTNQGTWQGL